MWKRILDLSVEILAQHPMKKLKEIYCALIPVDTHRCFVCHKEFLGCCHHGTRYTRYCNIV